jgi:hypothetical protein
MDRVFASEDLKKKISWCIKVLRDNSRPSDQSLAAEYLGNQEWRQQEIAEVLIGSLTNKNKLVVEGAIYGLSNLLHQRDDQKVVKALVSYSELDSPLSNLAKEMLSIHGRQ